MALRLSGPPLLVAADGVRYNAIPQSAFTALP